MTEQPITQKSSSPARIIVINLLMIVVFVLFFEILARIFLWTPINPYDSFLDALEQQQDTEYTVRDLFLGDADGFLYSGGYGDLMPDQNGTWNIWPHRPYHVVTNSAGLRNDEELFDNEEHFRILAIGDSFTFGPFVANEDTWALQLQAMLRQQHPDHPLQVLNAGIAGYTINDQTDYLVDKGLALEPDLVIFNFTPNDISDLAPIRDDVRRGAPGRPFTVPESEEVAVTPVERSPVEYARNILENFALLNVVRIVRFQLSVNQAQNTTTDGTGAVTAATAPSDEPATDTFNPNDVLFFESDTPENAALWQEYRERFGDMLDLLAENDIPVIVIAFPVYYQLPQDGYPDTPQQLVASVVTEKDVPYIDLLPVYRERGTIDSLYLMQYTGSPEQPVDDPFWQGRYTYTGNGHPSEYGYWVAADALVPLIDIPD